MKSLSERKWTELSRRIPDVRLVLCGGPPDKFLTRFRGDRFVVEATSQSVVLVTVKGPGSPTLRHFSYLLAQLLPLLQMYAVERFLGVNFQTVFNFGGSVGNLNMSG